MQRLYFVVVLSLLTAACASEESGDDERDDDFLADGKADGISEGSPQALGVLAVVNELSQTMLDDDVALDSRAARGIVEHRNGSDRLLGTSDDDLFDTLAELDAIPYVGPIAFAKLLAYAEAHGYVVTTPGGWQWENPTPDGNVRYATYAIASNDVWAVGAAGLVEHWDGSTWRVIPSGVDVGLGGVWASGPNDVWIVGASGTILRWNGSTMTRVPSGTTRTLFDVHGTSANDVWIVGGNDSGAFYGLILHWTGSAFAVERAGDCPNNLYAVHARAANDVWVGGDVKTVCHYNGTSWSSAQLTDSGQDLVSDIWVGATGMVYAIYSGEMWRRSGTTWSRVYALPDVEGWVVTSLYKLHALGDNDIWAAGTHGFVVHWNGTTWTPTRIPGNADYAGIAATGTSAWAVGAAARARFANGTWTESYSVATREWLRSIAGTSPTNLWALGSMSQLVRRTASGWTAVSYPLNENDYAESLFALSPQDLWITGAYRGAHWNGQSFTVVPELAGMRAVWGASATNLWAVGESGKMSRYNGAAWTALTSPTYETLLDVKGTGPNDVWAVGTGTILHFDGSQWTRVNTNDAEPYVTWTTIVALAPNDVWIAGESQNVRHWNGTTWQSIQATTATRPWLRSGWASGPSDIWFVETRQGLLRWNGSTFERTALPRAAAVIGIPANGMWVTGEDGMIQHRQ